MTDENNSDQDNSNIPPPPEVVELDPRIVQRGGTGANLTRIIEIIEKKKA